MSITIEEQDNERRGGASRLTAWLLAIVVASAALVLLGGSPAGASPAAPTACSTGALLGDQAAVDTIEAGAQQDFLRQLNELRRTRGMGSLAWNGAIATPSIEWSQTMSAQDWLHHARDTGAGDGVEPHEDYVTINSRIVANWQRLAENVGVSSMYSSCTMEDLEANTAKAVVALHNAFVNSSGHYANMVGDHNQVGIGVHIDHAKLWVTVRFAKGDLPTGSNASASNVVNAETAKYIDAVYQLFAGRTASSSEKTAWAPAVQSGNRKALTSNLAASDSWAGERVNELYQKILGRTADSGGRSYWLGQISRGFQLESAAVEFYGSNEYFVRNGSSNRSFVAALYRDLMGRSADSAGLEYWKGFLDRRQLTRSGVADNFYRSIESRRDRVSSIHKEIFSTDIAGAGRDQWADKLYSIGDVALAAELAASGSYWNLATQ
jgi:uncharacterized protein YkwD